MPGGDADGRPGAAPGGSSRVLSEFRPEAFAGAPEIAISRAAASRDAAEPTAPPAGKDAAASAAAEAAPGVAAANAAPTAAEADPAVDVAALDAAAAAAAAAAPAKGETGGAIGSGERLPDAGNDPPAGRPSSVLFAAGLRVDLAPTLLNAAAKSRAWALGPAESVDAAPLTGAASLFIGMGETAGIAFIPTEIASDVPTHGLDRTRNLNR